MSQDSRSHWTRREALGMLGLGAAAAMLPEFASAATPTFPKGAVIRTVLQDYAPEDLAGGATLFHEHMSFAADFMTRWTGYSAETRAINGPTTPPGGAGRAAGAGGGGGGAAGAGAAGAGRGAGAGGGAAAGGGTGAGGGRGAAAGGAGRAGAAPGTPAAPAGPYFMQDLDLMSDEMGIAKHEGIGCIVDGGHPDMGRDVNFLRQVSMKSGMPIVVGGGFYTQPFYPKEIATMSEEQIYQALLKQVDTDPIGVFGEIGSWDDMTADERKVFRAIGKAHLATNLPIFTHTGIPQKAALEQLDILEDAGVKPNRIVIGHLNNVTETNIQVHKAICRRGAFIGFDRQGGPGDASAVPMVMGLIDAGFADNLMFASDFSSAAQLKRNGQAGYAKTLTVFVPKLKAAGASDEVLRGIMQDNPRRFLAFVPKRPRPKSR